MTLSWVVFLLEMRGKVVSAWQSAPLRGAMLVKDRQQAGCSNKTQEWGGDAQLHFISVRSCPEKSGPPSAVFPGRARRSSSPDFCREGFLLPGEVRSLYLIITSTWRPLTMHWPCSRNLVWIHVVSPSKNPMKFLLILSPFNRWGNWGTEKLGGLSMVQVWWGEDGAPCTFPSDVFGVISATEVKLRAGRGSNRSGLIAPPAPGTQPGAWWMLSVMQKDVGVEVLMSSNT